MLDDYKNSQKGFYDIIKNTVLNNKVSHAYLIETNGYSDYKNLALSFAKTLYCKYGYVNFEKCNDCNICHLIDIDLCDDIKYINPSSIVIKKDEMLDLQEAFKTKSLSGNKRIYIIDNVDRLTKSSGNTILKFLEEPQEDIIAILLVNNRYNVIKTILSRCIVFSLDNYMDETSFDINQDVISFVNELEKEKEKFIVNVGNFIDFKKISKEYLLEFFNNLKLLYLKVMEQKIKDMSFDDSLLSIANENSIASISKKIIIIEGQTKLIKNNNNLNLLIDKFIIDFSEVDRNV